MSYTATNEIFLVTKADGSESRHIRADRLFSGIANDWYVLVNENGVTKRCLVSELMAKASDDRYMLVNTPEKVTPFTGPITQVGMSTTPFYENSLQVVDDNNNPYNGPWWNEAIHGDEEDAFDGDLSTEFKRTSPRGQDKEIRLLFTPATPIEVNNRIDVMCGFASFAPVGELYINGNLALTYTLSDTDPKVWNGVDFTGTLNSLMLRQRDYNPVDQADALTLSGIKIDDVLLVSNQSESYLEFANSDDFSRFEPGDLIQESDANQNDLDGVGQISKVESSSNRLVLTQIEPNWDVDNYVKGPQKDTIAINPVGPITDVSVITEPTWSDGVKVINEDDGTEYTGPWRNYEGEPTDIFDATDATKMYRNGSTGAKLYFEFTPPTPIEVHKTIEYLVGFHSRSTLGEIIVNGVVIAEHDSSDLSPVWGSTQFQGTLNSLAFKQKVPDPSLDPVKTFAVHAIKIDGEYLVDNRQYTKLELGADTTLSRYGEGLFVEEVDAVGNKLDGVGVIRRVEESPNAIFLVDNEPNWDVGSYLNGNLSEIPKRSWKIKSSTVAFAAQGFTWSDYAKILDERTGNEYTGSLINPTGDLTDCFDGNDSTWIYRAATITGATPQLYFEFIPPFPIRVNQSIEVLAGFHSSFNLGEIIVNGTPIGEFNAADGSPQWGSASFVGTINSLVVKQKVGASDSSNGMKTISLGAIKIDGDYIIDGQPV